MNLLINFAFFLLCSIFWLRGGNSNSLLTNVVSTLQEHTLYNFIQSVISVEKTEVQQPTIVKRNLRENKTEVQQPIGVNQIISEDIAIKTHNLRGDSSTVLPLTNDESFIVISVKNKSLNNEDSDISKCIRFYYSKVISKQHGSTFKEYIEYWFGYYSSVEDICEGMMKRHII
jgi:hypothetical protein